MKHVQEVLQVGTGDPVSGGLVTMQTAPANVLVTSGSTDTDGLADLTSQGSPGYARVRSERQGSTYDIYTENAYSAGRYDLENHRMRLKAILGNGPSQFYGDRFKLVSTGSGQITIGSGAVLLDGIFATFPSTTQLSVTNGDRAIVAVLSDDGVSLSEIAYSAISLTTHAPLWRYTVSSGNVVTSSLDWIATYAGPSKGHRTVLRQTRLSTGNTSNASGEYAGLACDITLENGIVYQIDVDASIITRERAGAIAIDIGGADLSAYVANSLDATRTLSATHSKTVTGTGVAYAIGLYHRSDTLVTDWTLLATYGPTFNAIALSTPGQVAVAPVSGKIYVADTGNNRLVRLTTAGAYDASITSLTGVTGVCVDSSDNVYVCYGSSLTILAKYNSSLVLQTSVSYPGKVFRHITTNDTLLWITDTGSDLIWNATTAGLGSIGSWGSAGAGSGQFNDPWGIVYDSLSAQLYIVDRGNSRVQVFTTAGVVQTEFPIPANSRGIASDGAGNIWVGCYADDSLRQYGYLSGSNTETVTQTDPDGVAVASGAVLWVSNRTSGTVAKWDEVAASFVWDNAVLCARAVPRS